jgi:hypothetical protein
MAVPVVIGKSTFDYAPLRTEQSRLAKTLVVPSPRDKDDTSQTLEVIDNQATPFKYPTFIKVFFDKAGQLPRFELWMKDNFDQQYNLSQGFALTGTPPNNAANSATTGIGINDDPLVGGFLAQSRVSADYVISPVTGEIRKGGTLNALTGLVTGGILVGTVKFDGVTGLALAAINTRIADISNSVEGLTKILSVVGGNLDITLNLIR